MITTKVQEQTGETEVTSTTEHNPAKGKCGAYDPLLDKLIYDTPRYPGLDPFTEEHQYGHGRQFAEHERALAIKNRVAEWLEYLEEIKSQIRSEGGEFAIMSALSGFGSDPEADALLLNTLVRLSAQEIDTLSYADIWRSDMSAICKVIRNSTVDSYDRGRVSRKALRIASVVMLAVILASCAKGNTQPDFDHIVCRVDNSLEVHHLTLGKDGTRVYRSYGPEQPGIVKGFGSDPSSMLYLALADSSQRSSVGGIIIGRSGFTSSNPVDIVIGYLDYLFNSEKVTYEETVNPYDPTQACVGVWIP